MLWSSFIQLNVTGKYLSPVTGERPIGTFDDPSNVGADILINLYGFQLKSIAFINRELSFPLDIFYTMLGSRGCKIRLHTWSKREKKWPSEHIKKNNGWKYCSLLPLAISSVVFLLRQAAVYELHPFVVSYVLYPQLENRESVNPIVGKGKVLRRQYPMFDISDV